MNHFVHAVHHQAEQFLAVACSTVNSTPRDHHAQLPRIVVNRCQGKTLAQVDNRYDGTAQINHTFNELRPQSKCGCQVGVREDPGKEEPT
ncbi:MAG TPA: hypothetical protein VK187_11355, partial [Geobacteraceae bacterium]|nr:hypothetical protein [Geobacteraceae bacterium]